MLAGVSASYYARLEQGESPSASAEVLDALAGALLRCGVTRHGGRALLSRA
jgi:transcriptional regulator with XRE-family HTH domain